MSKVLFIIVVFLNSVTFAKPALIVGDNVKKNLKELHRTDSWQLNQNGKKKLRRTSFIVEIDESSNNTFRNLKKLLKNGYEYSENGRNELSMKNEKVHLDLSDFDSNRVLCANKMLRTVLPNDYVNQFSLVSVDERRSFSVSQGVKVEGFTFNFKRVFKGRIVRNNENFLKIRVGQNGNLESVDVALQDLKTIAEEIDIDSDLDENEATLDSVLNENFKFAYIYDENDLEKKEKIEKVETGSVAEAYCEIVDGKKKKLFPCLSYASKINLSGKRKFDYIIDVPHSRKSWSDYHAKKSSIKFGSNRF